MKPQKPIKAAFFDIDGTLRSMKTHEIPQSTIDALKALKEQGVKLFISTGRQWWAIPDMDIEFDGFITANGSFCTTATGVVLQEFFLPESELRSLVDLSQKENFICYLSTKKRRLFSFLSTDIEMNWKQLDTDALPVDNLTDLIAEGVLQVLIYKPPIVVEQIIKQTMPSCYVSNWTQRFSDINQKGVSKQAGMDQFLAYYNIDVSETIAFGDGGNDLSMLKHAAVGVAMGNGQTHVKEAADYITDTVENDGIVKALMHWGLIEDVR